MKNKEKPISNVLLIGVGGVGRSLTKLTKIKRNRDEDVLFVANAEVDEIQNSCKKLYESLGGIKNANN